jgi:broad specificity phosphatase PhoE
MTHGRVRAREARQNGYVATRILLIRHAETDAGGRLCGSFDIPLSAAGRAQLEELLRHTAARPAPVALFTSTLRRAREVGCALGRAWGLLPQPAEWAREIDCGEVDGMPISQIQRERPELWARNEAQLDDTFAWPGGETYARFRSRVLDGLARTAATHAGRRIAVVTHAGVVSQVLGAIRGRPASAWRPDRPRPLTATEIAWTNGAPEAVVSYDDPDWW